MENIKKYIIKKSPTIVKLIFIFAVINFIISSVRNNLSPFSFTKIIDLLLGFNKLSIILLIILGNIIAVSVVLFDKLIIDYYGLNIKKSTIFYISYISNALNNIFGFGGLTGVSIRDKYFKIEDKKIDILDYSLLLIPVSSAGLSIWSIFLPLLYSNISGIIKIHKITLFIMVMFIVYLPLYFFIDFFIYKFRKTKMIILNNKRFILKTKLLLSSSLNWILTFLLFTFILKHFEKNVKMHLIFSIFILASISGIISMIPGGVGSFDLIILLGFQNFNIPAESIAATLVLFRLFDYLIPFIISIFLYLKIEKLYHIQLKSKTLH